MGPLCKSQLSFSFCLVLCAESLALRLVRIFSLVSAIWEFTSLCASGGQSSGLGFWDVKSQIACSVVVRLCQLSGEFVEGSQSIRAFAVSTSVVLLVVEKSCFCRACPVSQIRWSVIEGVENQPPVIRGQNITRRQSWG